MSGDWTLETSGRSDGVWFLRRDGRSCEALGPPGVRIVPARFEPADGPSIAGWRHALWVSDDPAGPLVDIDCPADVRSIDTAEALTLLGDRWHTQVRIIMVDQLQQAMAFGQAPGGLALAERRAHAGAQAVGWLLDQLRYAFPGEAWEMPAGPTPPVEMPATAEDLISRIPKSRMRREAAARRPAGFRHAARDVDVDLDRYEAARAHVARLILRGWRRMRPTALQANARLKAWSDPPRPGPAASPVEPRQAEGGMLADPDQRIVVGRR